MCALTVSNSTRRRTYNDTNHGGKETRFHRSGERWNPTERHSGRVSRHMAHNYSGMRLANTINPPFLTLLLYSAVESCS